MDRFRQGLVPKKISFCDDLRVKAHLHPVELNCTLLASTPSPTVELMLSVVFRGQSGGGVITKLHDRLGGIAGPHDQLTDGDEHLNM